MYREAGGTNWNRGTTGVSFSFFLTSTGRVRISLFSSGLTLLKLRVGSRLPRRLSFENPILGQIVFILLFTTFSESATLCYQLCFVQLAWPKKGLKDAGPPMARHCQILHFPFVNCGPSVGPPFTPPTVVRSVGQESGGQASSIYTWKDFDLRNSTDTCCWLIPIFDHFHILSRKNYINFCSRLKWGTFIGKNYINLFRNQSHIFRATVTTWIKIDFRSANKIW